MLARFAKLNIGAGQTFDMSKFSPEIQQAINDGVKDSSPELAKVMKQINDPEALPILAFGSRDVLKDDYLHRYAVGEAGPVRQHDAGGGLLWLLRRRRPPAS